MRHRSGITLGYFRQRGAFLTPAPGWLSLGGAGSAWEQCQSQRSRLRTEPAAEERPRRRRNPGQETQQAHTKTL